jgi:hypothetical protein
MLAMIVTFSIVNCEKGYPCLTGWPITGLCVGVGFVHIAIHVMLLHYLTPAMAQVSHEKKKTPYDVAARVTPSTFFSTNPVHCLRSGYFYKHKPRCVPYVPGKEHLLLENPDIGVFFEDGEAEIEDYLVRQKDQVTTFSATFAGRQTITRQSMHIKATFELEMMNMAGLTSPRDETGPPMFSDVDT